MPKENSSEIVEVNMDVAVRVKSPVFPSHIMDDDMLDVLFTQLIVLLSGRSVSVISFVHCLGRVMTIDADDVS